MPSRPPHVVLYRGAQNPVPVRQDDFRSWQQFVKEFDALLDTEAPDKRDLWAFSPHRLSTPYRLGKHVEGLSMLVLDVDRADLDTIRQSLDVMGFSALVYGSPSDDESSPVRRVRVVAPVTREIRPAECEHARFAFAELLGIEPGCGVEGAKDRAKFFFAGRITGTAPRYREQWTGEAVDLDALLAQPLAFKWASKAEPREPGAVDFDKRSKARAIAEYYPPAVEGQEGHRALYHVASEIATVIGEDADAIREVLATDYNPRCIPPWDDQRLTWEARRAVERISAPDARYARRRLEAAEARDAEAKAEPFGVEGDDNPWRNPARFSDPEEPIDYLCEGLRLAPSKGKITLIAGQPNAGKGPVANHLAVAFALGVNAFGAYPVRRSKVVLVDCEGSRLTMRRLRRLCRALGHDPRELDGWIHLVDASTISDLGAEANLDELRRLCNEGGCQVVILDSYTSAMLPTGIESNSPQYAQLARVLGSLDRLVIAVAHANKASASKDRVELVDVAYSGALASLAQTAILCRHNPDDDNVIQLSCARAPETKFDAFEVRFEDVAIAGDATAGLACQVYHAPVKPEDIPRPSPEARKALRKLADASQDADRVEEFLRDTDTMGAGVTPQKVRSAVGLSSTRWAEARAELRKRRSIVEEALSCDREVKVRLTEVYLQRVSDLALPTIGSVAKGRGKK